MRHRRSLSDHHFCPSAGRRGPGLHGSLDQLEQAGDVAIVGGGIIGLSLAFDLVRRGAAVSVYDTAEPARAASWAAAGMLAPSTEHIVDPPLRALCEESLNAYPAFVESVREASAIDPHLRLDGIVSAAHSEEDARDLDRRATELIARGTPATLLDREAALALEPSLGRSLRRALLTLGEGHVDNRRLGRALARACEAAGVRVHAQIEEVAIECDARRALGVRSSLGFHPASAVVNAAGAWAGVLCGVPPQYAVPVHPVKGQMLALAVPSGFVRRPLWVRDVYMVPREDGRLLLGATSEDAGYDVRVTTAGIDRLLHAAVAAIPALRDFTLTESWAGLRPGTPDGRPFIGPSPLRGYYLATGHYRNGILLAPATAGLLGDCIEKGSLEDLEPFSPSRKTKVRSA